MISEFYLVAVVVVVVVLAVVVVVLVAAAAAAAVVGPAAVVYMVASTHLKNISRIGSFPEVEVKIIKWCHLLVNRTRLP